MSDNFKNTLKKFPKEQQKALLETINSAEKLFPMAERTIAWGMPTLKIGEDNLCHVMGFKAQGKYKGKYMNGAWKFYRMDGSLMRAGSFKDGKQVGIWTTYDAKGKKVKETKF